MEDLYVEIHALRDLVQKKEALLGKIHALAERARLALLDHDVEMVKMLVRQIEEAK